MTSAVCVKSLQASGLITHGHPTAVAASIAAAYAVKLALDGVHVAEYLPRIMAFIDGISDEFDAAIYRVGARWRMDGRRSRTRSHRAGLGGRRSGRAGALLRASVIPMIMLPACAAPQTATATAIRWPASLEGSAARGSALEAIPAAWRERCENRDYLRDLAARMARAH